MSMLPWLEAPLRHVLATQRGVPKPQRLGAVGFSEIIASGSSAVPLVGATLWQAAQYWRNSLGPCSIGSACSIANAPAGGMPSGEPASSTARSALAFAWATAARKCCECSVWPLRSS